MVDDQRERGQAFGERRHVGEELESFGADVEGERVLGDEGERLEDVRAQEPVGICFAVDEVADADQPAFERPSLEDVGGPVRLFEGEPADDAGHEWVLVGDSQHVGGVGWIVGCLDEHDALDAAGRHVGLGLLERVGPIERGEVVGEPGVGRGL